MSDYPDYLTPERHRDLKGRRHQPWVRRAMVLVFTVALALALLNVFGQASTTASTEGAGARLEVRGPERVRGGLFYQQRITVIARRDIAYPRLVLSKGWVDGLQVNTIEPQPQSESSRDGRLVLSYDALSAGDRLEVYAAFQVDPTHVGKTDSTLELDDQDTPLATIRRSLVVLP